MGLDTFDGRLKVKWLKFGPSLSKILIVIHPVGFLLLETIQIRNGPVNLMSHGLGGLKLGVFDLLFSDVLTFKILLKSGKLLTVVEGVGPGVEPLLDVVHSWLLNHRNDRPIRHLLLVALTQEGFLVWLREN
jgi:hypothetical protein